jgi:hypothetical protein
MFVISKVLCCIALLDRQFGALPHIHSAIHIESVEACANKKFCR